MSAHCPMPPASSPERSVAFNRPSYLCAPSGGESSALARQIECASPLAPLRLCLRLHPRRAQSGPQGRITGCERFVWEPWCNFVHAFVRVVVDHVSCVSTVCSYSCVAAGVRRQAPQRSCYTCVCCRGASQRLGQLPARQGRRRNDRTMRC